MKVINFLRLLWSESKPFRVVLGALCFFIIAVFTLMVIVGAICSLVYMPIGLSSAKTLSGSMMSYFMWGSLVSCSIVMTWFFLFVAKALFPSFVQWLKQTWHSA